MTVMQPGTPKAQAKTEVLFKAGMLPNKTVGEPGIHGAGVAGMQGTGVGTPAAAAVAATKAGLVGDIHIPKGMILTMGLLSMILAAGWLPVITRFCGSTTSVLIPGGTANMHFSTAPLQTCMDISTPHASNLRIVTLGIVDSNQHFQEQQPCILDSNTFI